MCEKKLLVLILVCKINFLGFRIAFFLFFFSIKIKPKMCAHIQTKAKKKHKAKMAEWEFEIASIYRIVFEN